MLLISSSSCSEMRPADAAMGAPCNWRRIIEAARRTPWPATTEVSAIAAKIGRRTLGRFMRVIHRAKLRSRLESYGWLKTDRVKHLAENRVLVIRLHRVGATIRVPRMDQLKSLIREVSDFPRPGVNFYDITTLLKDRTGFKQVIDCLGQHYHSTPIDVVLGI